MLYVCKTETNLRPVKYYIFIKYDDLPLLLNYIFKINNKNYRLIFM